MARISALGLVLAGAALTSCGAPARPPAPATPAPILAFAQPVPAPPASTPTPTPAPVRNDPALPNPLRADPPPARAAPSRPAPPPPQLWPMTKIRGIDYVSLHDIAKRFELKAAWSKPEFAMTLTEKGRVRFLFETNQQDAYFDGLRVFLGHPALLSKDTLWVSLLDVIKIITPLLHPGDHAAALPATPPRTIVLDAGHGGSDPGTQNLKVGINEKTATLDVTKRLEKILTQRGWKVIMVRNEDKELSHDKKTDLLLRDDLANKEHADLFLSVHFNNAGPAVTGVETYWLAPQSMLSSGDESGDSMTNVAYPGNKLDYANLLFGEKMHRAMIAGLKGPDRGFKHARKAVLRLLDCPGALVECAFLSNDAEARRVATAEYREKIAVALADGLGDYADALAALHPAPTPPK